MRKIYPLTWALIAISAMARPQSPALPKTVVQGNPSGIFGQYISDAMKLWKAPGLSVVVVKDGRMVFKQGFGVTELGKPGPFTSGTLAICASTTKAMTAVCMGMLVDEGKLKWTDKLKDIYPEFRVYDPYVSAELTVRDLFTHNAGLGNADGLWVYGYSREEILHRMRLIKPAYAYHDSFIYQNLMYLVAGELIHHISGQSWEDFISQRLFRELGMNHTYPGYSYSLQESSHETPHFIVRDSVRPIPLIDYPSVGPAGGVWSCADDMEKWMLFLLDSATTSSRKRLITAATYREIFKPQTMVTAEQFYPTMLLTKPHWTTYGLGWFQEDYRGRMVQFHTGSLDGAVAIIGLIPTEHFGIYIFGNLDHVELRHALMYKAMDLYCFRDNGRDWSRDMFSLYQSLKDTARKKQTEEAARRVMGTRPSLPLASYAGHYSNEVYGDADILMEGDSLSMKLPNNISFKLRHWNFDSFVGYCNHAWWDQSFVKFTLDGEGKIAQFDMDGQVYLSATKK
ncbi:MAG TPA: serine hydrolase [Puia sp.]|nr:serine hydrolase [Puia sp.]